MKLTKTELKSLIKEALKEELGRKTSKRKIREATNDEIKRFRRYGSIDSDEIISQMIDDFGFEEAQGMYYDAAEMISEGLIDKGFNDDNHTWHTDYSLYFYSGDWPIVVEYRSEDSNKLKIFAVDGDGHRGEYFDFNILDTIPKTDYDKLTRKYPKAQLMFDCE